MLSNDFAEIDKEAERLASAAGAKPNDPGHIAILISLGVYMLLRLFSAMTLKEPDTAFWPVVGFTIASGGGFYAIQHLRRRAWWKRYCKALADIQALHAASEKADNDLRKSPQLFRRGSFDTRDGRRSPSELSQLAQSAERQAEIASDEESRARFLQHAARFRALAQSRRRLEEQ
jgi:hypothetical protein